MEPLGSYIYDGICIYHLHCTENFKNILNISIVKIKLKHIFTNYIASMSYDLYLIYMPCLISDLCLLISLIT